MPMTADQKEVYDLRQQGKSWSEIMEIIGLSRGAVRDRYARAIKHIDPAIQESMDAVKTGLTPALVWAKTKSEDGTSFSVLLKPNQPDPVDLAALMRDAFEDMTPSGPAIAPDRVNRDLLTLIPLFDAHIGMFAWSKETGSQDYDLKLAESDLRQSIAKIMQVAPESEKAVLLIGGDFFHADDQNNETPRSKHKLDVDSRHFRVVDIGVRIIAETIDTMLRRHKEVLVRVLRGNHDEHSHMILTFALEQRYRLEPRITVEKTPRDLFMLQWGRTAIFAHHGDKAKPQQMALQLSDVCPFWSETRHRYAFTGHIHHDSAKDFGPLRWESLRAFAPPDAYAASMGYGGRRALQVLTFHLDSGLINRAIDPIERESLYTV